MKVLIVTLTFPPEVGAAPTRLYNLAKGLVDRNIEVDVLTALPNYPTGRIFDGYRGKYSAKEEIDGITVYRYWVFASNSKNMWHRLMDMVSFGITTWSFAFKPKLIKKYDHVIIQTPHLVPAGSAAYLFKKVYQKNVLINISDIHPESSIEIGRFSEKSRKFKVLKRIRDNMYKRADAFIGQSNEILQHVHKIMGDDAKTFLYRNLQRSSSKSPNLKKRSTPFKIVYAGLVSPTQGIVDIAYNVDFKSLGAELHIYGNGADVQKLENGISDGTLSNVFYHGMVSKNEIDKVLLEYDASIVPLSFNITGAVPSKIFDQIKSGVPIIFCGVYAEAARIVEENKIGFTVPTSDYVKLAATIKQIKEMSDEEFMELKLNIHRTATEKFDFDKQFDAFVGFLESFK